MNWLKTFLNEPGTKEGSSHRLLLVLLIATVLVLVALLTIVNSKLPEVPSSLQSMIEYIGSILVGGMAFGKATSAYKAVKVGKEGPDVAVVN